MCYARWAAGNDFLGGGLGADTLTGGPGIDTLYGDGPENSGAGDDDTIYAIDGEADKIYRGGGIDTVHYDPGIDIFPPDVWSDSGCENNLTQ